MKISEFSPVALFYHKSFSFGQKNDIFYSYILNLDQVNLRLSGILRLSEPLGYVNFRFSGNP